MAEVGKNDKFSAKIQNIAALMDPVLDDHTVPRNVRRAISESKDKILDNNSDLDLQVSTALYTLDEIANDINMPMHARTEVWNIISELEKLKEELE